MLERYKELQIDTYLSSKVNMKWTIINTEKMIKAMKELSRNIELVFTDSTDQNATKSEWLLGGILNVLSKVIIERYEKKGLINNIYFLPKDIVFDSNILIIRTGIK